MQIVADSTSPVGAAHGFHCKSLQIVADLAAGGDIVSARIAEIMFGDEHAAIPVGGYHRALGVTLSLPSVVGRGGVVSVLEPELSAQERADLEKSAQILRAALERVGG